ncbi:MAG: hypothetical protein HYW26_06030 [Candidatus Aenigmarchaeota archaeon]|nr:hypothetical protein [Candidatus Aenigmarchaeota archaeon]
MKRSNFPVMFTVFLVLLASSLAFADYIDADAKLYTRNGTNLTVKGYIKFDNSSLGNYTNVTGYLGSSNFTVFSANFSSLGFYEFNVTTPNTTGRYNVSLNVTLNNGTVIRENIEIKVGSLANATFNFTNKRPPFANGSYFELNVSFVGTSPTVPNLSIFNPNGLVSTGWGIANLTTSINTNTILYNITVPAAADGRYVIFFDEGVGVTIFLVKSSVVAVANIQDTANSTATSFGQGESITILGKVRDENNAITNAVVNAFITLPNGTIVNMTLTHNGTGTDGTYNGTFNTSQFGSFAGEYKIEIVANASGKIVKSTSSATVQALEGKMEIVKDFFFDFGSQSAFQKGGNVEFNVLIFNLSSGNDILLNGSITTNSGTDVNCTALRAVELKNVLNGSTEPVPTIALANKTTNLFAGQTVCKIRFAAPNTDGIYSMTVNATVGANQTNNMSVAATGYFAVQSYILKPSPVSSLGGGKEFLSFLMPGDNATFEFSVRNLSASGAAVAGSSITNFNVTKITPMDFIGGGQSEITNIFVPADGYTNGTATANPKLKLKLPENRTGPFQIEFQATVANSTIIRGTAFYFARYVEGFVFPDSFGGGFDAGPGGGPGESPGGNFEGGNFRCSGLQNFSARIFDVRTRGAARNVVFNSIQEVREELTGRSVASSVALASSAATDSNGVGNMTLNFSGSLSGFHFMLVNITTADGKYDTLPGGFECRQLSFFPQIAAVGSTGTGGSFVAPTSLLNITISGVKNLNTRNSTVNGTVSIVRLESFDPSRGPKFVPGLVTTYNITNGVVNFNLSATAFSSLGGKWFNGFNNLIIRVCDDNNNTNAADDVCDTSFGGFMVVAFDAFPDFQSGNPQQALTAGQAVTYNIMARTNVTTSLLNFTVQVGLPWEGSIQDATITNYSKKSDGWNNSAHIGWNDFERWNVTFTVPSNLRKGFNMIIIKVHNYLNESVDVMMFGTASKLSIAVPDTEGALMSNFGVEADGSDATNVTNFYNNHKVVLTAINASFKSTTSKSGRVCVINSFNVTRFGMGGDQRITYNATTTLVALDNATAGVYDTLVINNSNRIAVVNANNRSLASAGFGGLYLVKVEECGYVKLLNSTITESDRGSGFGGQHAVNTIATIPFVVKQGTAAKPSVIMDVFQMIQQEDFGGGRGGFGFKDFLPASNFTKTAATTDANGVAFLQLNVSKSGLYSIMWNFTDGSDSDIADFSEGVPIEVKAFRTDLDSGTSGYAPHVITLTRTANNATYNATITGETFYLGTWNESTQGDIVNSSSSSEFYYFALRNATQAGGYAFGGPLTPIAGGHLTELVIDDDSHLNTNNTMVDVGSPPAFGNWTAQIAFSPQDAYKVDGNQTVNSTVMKIILGKRNEGSPTTVIASNSATDSRNITVRACAFTYSRPETPLIGANVTNVTTQSFSFNGPPTTENLTMFDPFTNSVTLSVLTGPSGCAAFNVTRTGGWRSGMPNEIKGAITSGGSTEQAFLGNVFVCQGCSFGSGGGGGGGPAP